MRMILLLFLILTSNLGVNAHDVRDAHKQDTSELNREMNSKIVSIVKVLTSIIPEKAKEKVFVDITVNVLDVSLGSPVFSNLDEKRVEKIQKLERQVEEIGIKITNSILETKAICSQTIFEEIAMRAGALFSILLRAMIGLLQGEDVFVKILLHSCQNKVSLPLEIYSIPVLLQSSKYNPIESSMAADPYHKNNTIERTKLRIINTAHSLALVEAFRLKFANEKDQIDKMDAILNAVQGIDNELNQFVIDYANREYFHKVKNMIPEVMKNLGGRDDKTKAVEMMKILREIHTNDRFVVVVYAKECNMKTMFEGTEKNLAINEEYRTIVYRSVNAMNMKTIEENDRLEVQIHSKYRGFLNHDRDCRQLIASDIMPVTKNSGLVLMGNRENMNCATIEQDERFRLKKHSVKCNDRSQVEKIYKDVYSYPF